MGFQRNVAFWGGIIVAVLAILGLIQILRVNSPEVERTSTPVVRYTSGSVIEGHVTVQQGEFLSFRMNLNRAAMLKGTFDAVKRDGEAACLILDDENFTRFRKGGEFTAELNIGPLPSVVVSRKIGPGVFHLIFDNRSNKAEAVDLTTSFTVE